MSTWSGPPLPTGTLTFLFTDVEGSTRLWETHPQAMRAVMARHDALLTKVFAQHDGIVVRPRGEGDSLFVVFIRASDAIAAALAGQCALLAEEWGEVGSLRVRMGLHTGEADLREGDYYGSAVNRTARIRAAGHGGQVLISEATAKLVRGTLPPGVALLDLGRHRLKDLAEAEQLWQLTAPQLPEMFPPPLTVEVAPVVQLPTPLTSFLGRKQELAEVIALLGTTRLLTLAGPGGTGKTRLAVAAARQVVEQFPDGVWFVDLSGVSDPAGVIPAIAQVLEVRESEGRSLAVSLATYLRSKRLLLLLDNFEQVVEAALVVYDLLVEAPHLTMLVTSRILLHLDGEQEYAVPPLPLPTETVLAAVENEAVQLFVQRARAVRSEFVLTPELAPVVAAICRRLDGLPLAIELAAARVKLLPPAVLLTRLEQRLPLLTGGARSLPQRQQTLRNTIQWSWDLLTSPEQVLFQRLGVFAGGWTLEAAEAVCAPDRESDVLEGLAALVDKSLVRQQEVQGAPHFSMLATLREFALEHLHMSGELDSLSRRHAQYYLGMATAAADQIWRYAHTRTLLALDAEQTNLRTALAWAEAASEVDLGLQLVGQLSSWFAARSPSEGRRTAERLLTLSQTVSPHARALGLFALGRCALDQNDVPAARNALTEAVTLWRTWGERPWRAWALLFLGELPRPGHPEDGVVHHQEIRSLIDEQNLPVAYAILLIQAATSPASNSTPEVAAREIEHAVALMRRLESDWTLGWTLNFLGFTAWQRGELARARQAYEEALRYLSAAGGAPAHRVVCLYGLAAVALSEGRPADAAIVLRSALQLEQELGSQSGQQFCLLGITTLLAHGGMLREAAILLGATAAARAVMPTTMGRAPFAAWFQRETELRLAERLDADDHAAAVAEGASLSLEQATDCALTAVAILVRAPVR